MVRSYALPLFSTPSIQMVACNCATQVSQRPLKEGRSSRPSGASRQKGIQHRGEAFTQVQATIHAFKADKSGR